MTTITVWLMFLPILTGHSYYSLQAPAMYSTANECQRVAAELSRTQQVPLNRISCIQATVIKESK